MSLVTLVSGRATRYLAEKIAQSYGTKLGEVSIYNFSDGEFQPSYEETIRGNDVFIVQSTFAPSDNLMELLMLIDAAKRASASKIIAIIPYFGFARQDRKDKPRVSIGAKLIANLLTAAGVNRIITMDLHADQIQGFFDVPVDHLYASTVFVPYLQKLNLENLCMASPDTGGTRRAAAYAKFLNADLVIGYKQRAKANVIDRLQIIGDVKDKNVVIVDDIIDTAGTICKAANLMKESGAASVRALCTHPIFSGNAVQLINDSALCEVIVTDTLPLREHSDKITQVSVSGVFADVISSVITGESISSHFQFSTIQ
ncbi:MAG: ribose-phosphate pyrophosphokinase [Bacteroidales bacterium]|nr:ribose-phosphate pyrophosphokinase [Bacteroidales bacterium]MDY0216961.1 ribose-phosphate pyrophosphokinase [Bacteroidales bacterium]